MKPKTERDGLITAWVFGLVIMAVWTIVIKFLAPIHWYAAERLAGNQPDTIPVLWDFWWVAHLWLAWALWTRSRLAWAGAVAVAVIETAIVVIKFVMYLPNPDTTFWRLMWFTNKVYVLAFFASMAVLLFTPGVKNRLRFDKSAPQVEPQQDAKSRSES